MARVPPPLWYARGLHAPVPMIPPNPSTVVSRRAFLRRSSAALGGLAALGPLHALGLHAAAGEVPPNIRAYGPLVNKGDLWLPAAFNYQIVSRQGDPMSDGAPTPNVFDGMGAFAAPFRSADGTRPTILIRNHEHREFGGEQKVITGTLEYDELTNGGNTKLVVERRKTGQLDPASGQELYEYTVVNSFAILGGTSTNCAGGEMPFTKWVTCEETVKRSANGRKHGYVFEMDAAAEQPVAAVPVLGAGRMVHEATAWRAGALYLTEDRGLDGDPRLGTIGSCFYRYRPDQRLCRSGNLGLTTGVLEALRLKEERHANMDAGRVVGKPHPVKWVTVDEPDHDDDSDNRRDRVPGFTPTRIQAQDKGAAFFDRLEGIWARGSGRDSKLYFVATTGGPANLGQVWEYDVRAESITLIYESVSAGTLENPDNIVVVPPTNDVFLCEDGGGDQYIRGLTRRGEIYDFAKTTTNHTEFCGACFDRGGHTLYVNQQGVRGELPNGPAGAEAVTYAIYGPFGKRRR